MEPAPWFYWLIRMLGISLSKIWTLMMVFLAVLLILLLRLDAINCLDVTSSRCDVWCVTRDCVTGRWRDWGSWYPGVTQETRQEQGERLAVCIRPDASNNGYMLSAWQWSVLLSWMLYPGIESLQCPSTWITRVRAESLWPSFNASNASSFPPLARNVVACLRVFA